MAEYRGQAKGTDLDKVPDLITDVAQLKIDSANKVNYLEDGNVATKDGYVLAKTSDVESIEDVIFLSVNASQGTEVRDAEVVSLVSGCKPIYNPTYNLYMLEQNTTNTTTIYRALSGKTYTIHGYGNDDEMLQPLAFFTPNLEQRTNVGISAVNGHVFAGASGSYQYWDVEYTPSIDGYFYVRGGSSSVKYMDSSDVEPIKVVKKDSGLLVKDGTITHFYAFASDMLLCREFKRFRINNLLDIYRMYIGHIEDGDIAIDKVLGVSDGDTIGPISIHRKDVDGWVGQWAGGAHGKTVSGTEYPTAVQKSIEIYCDGKLITSNGIYFGSVSIVAKNDIYFPQTITGASVESGIKALEEVRVFRLSDKMDVQVTLKPVYDDFVCNQYYGCQYYKYDGIRLLMPNSEKCVNINPSEQVNFEEREKSVIIECVSGALYTITLDDVGIGSYAYNDGTGSQPYGYFSTFGKGYFFPVGNKNVYMNSSKEYVWRAVYDYKMP